MKIHILHDNQGNIRSLMVPAPEFVDTIGVVPKQGEQVTIVEHPDLSGEQIPHHLRDLHERFRVDLSSGKLVQK